MSVFTALLLSPPSDKVNTTILVIVVLVLILLSGITAGARTAFFSFKAKDLNYLKTKDSESARQVIRLISQPQSLFSTLLVVNTFLNIVIVTTSHTLLSEIMPSALDERLKFLLELLIIALGILLIGVVIPKVYAAQNNMRMAIFSAPVVVVLQSIFRPISDMLSSSNRFIGQRTNTEGENPMSQQEFEHAIEQTMGHTASMDEVKILRSILRFGKITARQVMQTRLKISGVEMGKSYSEVIAKVREAGFSRLPVYKTNLDQIAGVLHSKDLLAHMHEPEFNWHALIRPPMFIPESKPIEDLLKEFQEKRVHMAIVVDEFGGTNGIVTFEDIVEEITGDIRDEFDQEEELIKKTEEGVYIVDGRLSINDLCRQLSVPIDSFDKVKGMSDSVAGLLLELLKKFPNVNETIVYGPYQFTVLTVDQTRIEKVKLALLPKP